MVLAVRDVKVEATSHGSLSRVGGLSRAFPRRDGKSDFVEWVRASISNFRAIDGTRESFRTAIISVIPDKEHAQSESTLDGYIKRA